MYFAFMNHRPLGMARVQNNNIKLLWLLPRIANIRCLQICIKSVVLVQVFQSNHSQFFECFKSPLTCHWLHDGHKEREKKTNEGNFPKSRLWQTDSGGTKSSCLMRWWKQFSECCSKSLSERFCPSQVLAWLTSKSNFVNTVNMGMFTGHSVRWQQNIEGTNSR